MANFVFSDVLNGHSIGIIMKEMVFRAIREIREQRFVFETQRKIHPDKTKEDFVTSADKAAQAVYLKSIRECFPNFGVIAEENDLSIKCRHKDDDIYFTVDPLDGTKAFIRRQSDGIGTMISLVYNGEVIASYIGDINTQEIYGYRPGSDKVWRISEQSIAEELKIDPEKPLSKQVILLRDHPNVHSEIIKKLCDPDNPQKLFKDVYVSGGSIGISTAKLWKSEVGAAVVRSKFITPWDQSPMFGICRKLGFIFISIDSEGNIIESLGGVKKETIQNFKDHLIVHKSRLSELKNALYKK